MPEYVGPAVERMRGSDATTDVTLLLGVADERERTIECVERTGATVDDAIGRATLQVTAPKSAVADLTRIETLSSIELERDDVRTLDEGNDHSRRRVTR